MATTAAAKRDILSPKTKEYEFLGPFGTALMTLGLPSVVIGLYVYCGAEDCSLRLYPTLPKPQDFWHPTAFMIFVLWFIFHAILYLLPLGKTVNGTKLRDGTTLRYKLNGLHAFVISHILFVVGYCYFKVPVTFVYDHYLALAMGATVFSFALAVYLYVKSFTPGALLAVGGNSGNVIYDWFVGRELNPRIGIFDWKIFCEMRPGLIGWVLINYCMLAKQYETYGFVTNSMVLVCFFQFWYILDSFWAEEALLTTMDIIHDGFGFMLAFGDLAWVPFTYSLQARYLVDHPVNLPLWAAVAIFVLNAGGYVIFRGANSQKDAFRRDPNHPSVSHLKTMPTERGTKLIISGWWGICRHPNYVGDLVMALSWSLPCGFNHFLPYFYVTYFAVLLIHRQLRDEHHCKQKYGKDWDKFCQVVKWRLIPGIY